MNICKGGPLSLSGDGCKRVSIFCDRPFTQTSNVKDLLRQGASVSRVAHDRLVRMRGGDATCPAEVAHRAKALIARLSNECDILYL